MIEIFRGGESAGDLSRVADASPNLRVRKNRVRIGFGIPAAGGGRTIIASHVDPDSFEELAITMVQADRERAERAFLIAMLEARTKGAK